MLASADNKPGAALGIGALEAVPHHTGALWLPSERTLLISDLHLEKASAYAMRGVFLPPYDTATTLAAVRQAVQEFEPHHVIAMGDSFHDRHGAARLGAADIEALAALQSGRHWLWLTGNHDPEAAGLLPGDVADQVVMAGVRLVHEPSARDGCEIAGHLHPVARLRLRGKSLRRRCFIGDGTRLVMPAMGALAGGLNVRDAAFKGLFPRGADVTMLGDGRTFNISRTFLLAD
jgi:uncharacterized protein